MTNDEAYFLRRDQLLRALQATDDWATCGELAEHLGWGSAEVRAKLMSLRVAGCVAYGGRQGWIAR